MPLVRIKRMGKQWATCGIQIRPPEDMIGSPGIKRRCTKLVPGQVVDLPKDHTIWNQGELIEQVRRVMPDEILRPWVFPTADAALAANPTKARLTHDQIQQGLVMAEGAIDNADYHREKARKERAGEADNEPDEDDYIELEPEEKTARRAKNRQTQDVYEDARPIEDDPEEPRSRSRGKRPADAEEDAPRSPRRRAAVRRREE